MQLKKIFVSLLVVIMILSTGIICATAADDNTMTFSVAITATENVEGDAVVAKPGDTIKVDVKITNNPGASMIAFTVGYDADVLKPIDADEDGVIDYESEEDQIYTFVDGGVTQIINDAENGTIVFTSKMGLTLDNVTATGFVATINFEVIANAEGNVNVTVENTKAYNKTFDKVASTGADATVSIHNYVENAELADACIGKKVFECAEEGCDAQYVTIDPEAPGHVEKTLEAQAPNCTETGLTEGVQCSVCEQILVAQEVVPALGHTEETLPAVAPKCTETGLTSGVKCSVCQVVLTAQETVPATGHSEKDVFDVAPTCTTSGITAGKQCTVCGQFTVAQGTVPALGHNAVVVVDACAATCTEAGHSKVEKCDRCNIVLTEEVEIYEATKHTESDWTVVVEATCLGKGLKQKTCTVCNEILVQEEIAADGHTEGEWTVVVEATCLGKGLKQKTCTVCDALLAKEDVAAAGHTESAIAAVAPTCTEAGSTAGVKCSVCDLVLEAPEVVQPKGHTEEVIPAVEPTYSEDGSTEGKKCTTCGTITDATGVIPAKSLAWLWVLIAAVVVMGAGVAVYFFVLRKKTK